MHLQRQRQTQTSNPSSSGCTCGTDHSNLDRRSFLTLASASLVTGLFTSQAALADRICKTSKPYDALVLSCINPRIQKPVYDYLLTRVKPGDKDKGLQCKYSQVTVAGAAIGVVAPKYQEWHATFWANLGITIQLHQIPKIIAINHRDCGAARDAYGPFHPDLDQDTETNLHRKVLKQFRQQVARHHPQLEVEMLLMGLDGQVTDFTKP